VGLWTSDGLLMLRSKKALTAPHKVSLELRKMEMIRAVLITRFFYRRVEANG
jgi:hypothetical protein